ncbi:T9SS type A sorting domain-containing protein [Flavisolibacter sp. BT320]|nr:T9SS type A sorting domain-containing protein [Flavisolibacter longurius]
MKKSLPFTKLLLFATLFIGTWLTTATYGQTSQTFNANGTFTVPANVNVIIVEAWGGGAGGRTANSRPANGGGGGAYARSVLTVTPGANIPYTIGAGGVIDGPGGNSVFGANLVVAAGAANQNGGLASASTGQVRFSGGIGGNNSGNSNNSAGGGGGSSASFNADGVPGADGSGSVGGAGGNGPDGDGGRGGDGGSTNIHGQPGTAPGGGGGGKGANGNSAPGAAGRIVVHYYLINSASASSAACPGNSSTITLSSASLLAGKTYTITYTLSGANTGSGTATMVVSTDGTGTFTTSALANAGNTTLTITNISTGFISMAPSGTTTASITVAPLPQSGTVTKAAAVNVAAVCSGIAVSATATPGSGGAGTTADLLLYRYDGTGNWTTYVAGTEIPTTGHTKVEIQTYRTANGTGCTQSSPVIVAWTINPRPTVGLTINENPLVGAQDATICTGGEVTLTGNGGGSLAPYTYAWVTGATTFATTQSVTVDPTANTDYLVTVTDANGCTNTRTQTVTVNALPTVSIGINESPLVGAQDATICTGGGVTLTASAGSSYAWSGGSTATSQNITVNPGATTTYTVTVTNANGCKGTASQTVTVNPLPVVSFTAAPSAPVCAGSEVTYTTQAGQSNYTWTLPAPASDYTITGGSTTSNTLTLRWNSGGAKIVRVNYTNSDGCTATTPATTTTTVNALPTFGSVSSSTTELCSGGSATITLSGLLPDKTQTITYTIGGQSQSVTVTSNSSGTATFTTIALSSANSAQPLIITGITRTDVSPNCSVLSPANAQTTLPKVTDTDLIAPTIAKPAAINVAAVCAGQQLTVIKTADGSGGVANQQDQYRFSTNGGTTWSNWSTTIPSFAAVAPSRNLIQSRRWATGGVCDASGTNTQFWDVTAMATVSAPSPAVQNLCLGAAVTSLSVTVTGGNGAFTYQWYSNTNNQNSGGTEIAGATDPTYTPSASAPGTTYYYCIVTQAGVGCGSVTSATASITVAPLPQSGTVTKAAAVNVAAVCSGIAVSATATPGSGGAGTTADLLLYRYDGTGNWTTYVAGTEIPTTGHTKVEIQTYRTANGTGCTQSSPVIVAWTINPRPTVGLTINENPLVGAQDATICTGGEVTLTGNGGGSLAPYTYAWVTGATTFATTQSVTVDPTANTDYLVTVTDANGCTNTRTQTVTVNALPTVSIGINESPLVGAQDATICTGGGVTLTASAGSSYAWSGGSTATSQNITVNPGATTTYTVTVTNANGCKGTASQTVTVNPLPVVSFTAAPSAPVCAGSEVTYTTQAGQSNYTWTLPAPASDYTITGGSTTSNTLTLRWNSGGAKIVRVNYTNSDGCTATTPATTTTTVNALPTISGVSTVTAVCGRNVDQITSLSYSSTSNSPTSYSIDWSDAANAAGLVDQANAAYVFASGAGTINTIRIPAGTLEGIYSGVLTITNNNGCTSSQPISVNVSPYPFLTMEAAAKPVCFSATAQSTTLVYSFAYATPTTYSITWSGTPTNSFAPVSNATLPASPIAIAVPAGTAAGTYTGTLTVKNAAGCESAPVNFTVTVNALPAIASITPATPAVCVGSTITLANANAGGSWSSLNTAQATVVSATGVVSGLTAGIATIQYTSPADANGCTNSTTTTVTVNPLPTATISGTTAVCKDATTAPLVTFTGAGGTAPYTFTYKINNGADLVVTSANGTSTATVTAPTNVVGTFSYTLVSVQDATSTQCSRTITATPVVVTINPLPTATISGTTAVCKDATTAPLVTFTGAGGTAPYTFTYKINNGADLVVTSANGTSTATVTAPTNVVGTFSYTLVSVQDASSTKCIAAVTGESLTVTVNAMPTANAITNQTVCNSSPTTVINISGSNATSYNWTNNTPSIGLAGSGTITGSSGSIPSFTAINTGNAPVIATIIVTPVNTANGISCAGAPVTFTLTINPTNTVTAASSAPTVCINTPLTAITHTTTWATGIANNNVAGANGLPPGVRASFASNTITISGTPTQAGSFAYSISLTGGCGSINATGTITVTPVSVGGSITPAAVSLCSTEPGGDLTVSGYTGDIKMWQYSTDGGANWINITNTSNTQPYTSARTTLYRAVIQNGPCSVAYSSTTLISVIGPVPPVVSASPATICLGETSTLTALTPGFLTAGDVDGTFNQANPDGWRVTDNGKEIKFPADANNASTFPWSETNGPKTPFNGGTTYDNLQTDGKFAIASGTGTTTLESPVFSTVGMTSAAFELYQALVFAAGASGTIELSTDGGVNYTTTLAQYTGPLSIGTPASSWEKLSLDLSAFLGQTSLRIRFTYKGANNSNWAIDGMKIPGPGPNVHYAWVPTNGLPPSEGKTVTVSPTSTTTYNLSTTISGCPGGMTPVTVNVRPLPTATMTVSSTDVCEGGPAPSLTFTGATGTAPYTFTYTVNGATQTIKTSSGNSVTITLPTTTAGTFTYNLVSVSESSSTTCSQAQSTTRVIKVNPRPTATISGGAAVCQNATAPSVTFTGTNGTAPYTFTYTDPTGATKTITSQGTSNSVTLPQSTATAGTYTYTLVSVQDASSTTCARTITGQTASIIVDPETVISGTITGTRNYCLTNSATPLTVNAFGKGLSYQWYTMAGQVPAPATDPKVGNNSNSFTPPIAEGTTSYYVVITGACGMATSEIVPVTVIPPLTLTQQAPVTPCYQTEVKMTVLASVPSRVIKYQWFKMVGSTRNPAADTKIGTNSPTFTIASVTAADNGNYYLEVTGNAPCSEVLYSDPITINSSTTDVTTWVSSTEDPTEWHLEKNWTCGIPNLYRDAIVPISFNNQYPYINNDPALPGQTRDLRIDAGGPKVTLDGLLQMAGNVTNNGNLDAYLTGTTSTGTLEFVSNINFGSYPSNDPASELKTLAGTGSTQTQHLRISRNVSFAKAVDVYGKVMFGGSNRTLATGDILTLKSVSSLVSAMVTDRTNNGTVSNNAINGQVTVERFIDGALGRKFRVVTAPVKDVTINKAWQEGMTMNNGSHVLLGTNTPVTPPTGFGTLITGGGALYPTASAANAAGFDFWDAIAGGTASINTYTGNPDWRQARWTPVTTTKTTGYNDHQAYLIYIRGDRFKDIGTASNHTVLRPKGSLKEELEHQFTVHATNSHTLVGNPYASPLDFRKIYKANIPSIQPYYWIWQAVLTASWGGYAVIRPQAAGSDEYEMIPYESTTATKVEPIISSGQGFFVIRATSPTSPTMTIHQTHKSDGNSKISVFRETGEKPKKLFVNVYTPASIGGEAVLLDGVLAEFTSEDKKTGISKMLQSGENLSVWKNSRDLIVSVDALPQVGDKVQLKLWNTSVKGYRLGIKSANFSVPGVAAYLEDKFLGTETLITPGDAITTYDFQVTGQAASRDPQRFAIVFKVAPLPVVTLEGIENRNGVKLQWQAAEDLTVAYYELEKSIDGAAFTTINKTASRRRAETQQYDHLDGQAAMQARYRVKMTGVTGAVGYSNIVTVELKQASGLTIYPNPVTGQTASLQFTAKPRGRYNIIVYAPTGQQVASQVVEHNGGMGIYEISVGNLASGSYTLEVWHPDNRKEKIRLVITH